MKKRFAIAGVAVLTMGGAVNAQDATEKESKELKVGDKAPALEHVDWVQGDPVREYQSGDIYILDFWATWCGPCKAAIPHMNEIAKEHKDDGVHVIGVAIWPSPNMVPTADFVKDKGDAMSYLIAEDNDAGDTATAFMKPTMSNGIPTVMIVNRDGKLAWIGHPMNGMDEALEEIIEGTYDLKAAAEKDETRRSSIREQRKLDEKLAPIYEKLNEAMMDRDYDKAMELFDQAIAVDPDKLSRFHINKYNIALVEMEDAALAKRIAADIEGSNLMDNANALNSVAWTIVDPNGPVKDDLRDLDFALRLAEKADKLTEHENASILDTVARVWFEKGDIAKAITIQKEAIEHADNDQMKTSLEETLKEYQETTRPS